MLLKQVLSLLKNKIFEKSNLKAKSPALAGDFCTVFIVFITISADFPALPSGLEPVRSEPAG